MGFKPKQWVQRLFTEGLKREIKERGLIDTGTLYASIDINIDIDDYGVMTIDVYAVDYLKYLWFAYNLEQFVYKGSYVWSAYAQWTAWKVTQNPLLTWKVDDPKIIFNLPE